MTDTINTMMLMRRERASARWISMAIGSLPTNDLHYKRTRPGAGTTPNPGGHDCYPCRMKRSPLILLLALPLAGCQTMQHITSARVHPAAVTQAYNAWPSGKFDNHEQVWSAHESAANAIAPPHVVIAIDA